MAHPLTFTKYCELVVARLYELEQDGRPPRADLLELMADLDDVVPSDWPYEAAHHLAGVGFAHDYIGFGSPEIQLNARGRLLAESGAGIIGDYRQSQVVFTVADGGQIAVGHGRTVSRTSQGDLPEEVGELLDLAETTLRADTTLTASERDDGLADVSSMRTQLAKATPNRRALTALAAALPTSAALADTADRLRRLVG